MSRFYFKFERDAMSLCQTHCEYIIRRFRTHALPVTHYLFKQKILMVTANYFAEYFVNKTE